MFRGVHCANFRLLFVVEVKLVMAWIAGGLGSVRMNERQMDQCNPIVRKDRGGVLRGWEQERGRTRGAKRAAIGVRHDVELWERLAGAIPCLRSQWGLCLEAGSPLALVMVGTPPRSYTRAIFSAADSTPMINKSLGISPLAIG